MDVQTMVSASLTWLYQNLPFISIAGHQDAKRADGLSK